jgi:hypothetical protein
VGQRKPWITTLVLIGVLAVLAVVVLLVSKRPAPPEEGAVPTPSPLWTFSGGDVTAITVTMGLERVAVRHDPRWRMVQPAEGEADEARLIDLSYKLADLRYTRALADVESLATYGLQPAQVQATLAFSDGTKIDLSIGTTNPGGESSYVQKAGDPQVYLVSATDLQGLLDLVNSPPYAPTPAPSPSPLETPTVLPTPAPTETPAPTRTPRPTPSPSPTPSP